MFGNLYATAAAVRFFLGELASGYKNIIKIIFLQVFVKGYYKIVSIKFNKRSSYSTIALVL
jgi:hypothetical protein